MLVNIWGVTLLDASFGMSVCKGMTKVLSESECLWRERPGAWDLFLMSHHSKIKRFKESRRLDIKHLKNSYYNDVNSECTKPPVFLSIQVRWNEPIHLIFISSLVFRVFVSCCLWLLECYFVLFGFFALAYRFRSC